MVDSLQPYVTNPPTPWVSLAQPPDSGWERTVTGAGQAYSNLFPAITGFHRVMTPRANDSNALASGSKGVLNGMAYQALSHQALKLDGWMKRQFPGYGEFSNRHPILAGLITMGWVVPVAMFGADALTENSLVSGLINRFGEGGKRAMHRNTFGKTALSGWQKVKRVIRHPTFITGTFVVTLALLVGLLIKGAKDGLEFKQAYNKARSAYPDRQQVDPATLRASLVSVLSQPELTQSAPNTFSYTV